MVVYTYYGNTPDNTSFGWNTYPRSSTSNNCICISNANDKQTTQNDPPKSSTLISPYKTICLQRTRTSKNIHSSGKLTCLVKRMSCIQNQENSAQRTLIGRIHKPRLCGNIAGLVQDYFNSSALEIVLHKTVDIFHVSGFVTRMSHTPRSSSWMGGC